MESRRSLDLDIALQAGEALGKAWEADANGRWAYLHAEQRFAYFCFASLARSGTQSLKGKPTKSPVFQHPVMNMRTQGELHLHKVFLSDHQKCSSSGEGEHQERSVASDMKRSRESLESDRSSMPPKRHRLDCDASGLVPPAGSSSSRGLQPPPPSQQHSPAPSEASGLSGSERKQLRNAAYRQKKNGASNVQATATPQAKKGSSSRKQRSEKRLEAKIKEKEPNPRKVALNISVATAEKRGYWMGGKKSGTVKPSSREVVLAGPL